MANADPRPPYHDPPTAFGTVSHTLRRHYPTLFVLIGLLSLLAVGLSGRGPADSSVFGTVTNGDGRRLADAEILLQGPGAAIERTTTDDRGRFRMQNLLPGNYRIEAFAEGHSRRVYAPVHVRMGRSTTVHVQLNFAVRVTGSTPIEPTAPAPEGDAPARDDAPLDLPAAQMKAPARDEPPSADSR
ncbi:MAG: carboxypeptidase-like regulatory domain-containing protein [Acidobacteriota bacterium]